MCTLNTHNKEMRKITFSESIREGILQAMEDNSSLIVIGEGVPDTKAIFETTKGLRGRFGENRVFDMPLSENGMTGICIGAALNKTPVLMIHQRIDFVLLAMDQIVNNAAKWHYMFNGQASVPIVIRVIVGRGWGQGPQHSQNLQALFAHIPGLKVVAPATAKDAKGLMIAALRDQNPVVFIEHRWLHHIKDHVPEELYELELGKAKVVASGSDVTIVANSLATIESIKAERVLRDAGVSVEVVDLRSVKPLDVETIVKSVRKTKKVVVVDFAWKSGGVSGELISLITEQCFDQLEAPPVRVTFPDHATPTSHFLAEYYKDAWHIAEQVLTLLGRKADMELVLNSLKTEGRLDVPSQDFHGPF